MITRILAYYSLDFTDCIPEAEAILRVSVFTNGINFLVVQMMARRKWQTEKRPLNSAFMQSTLANKLNEERFAKYSNSFQLRAVTYYLHQ